MKKIMRRIVVGMLLGCLFLGGVSMTSFAQGQTGTFTAVAMNVDGLPQKISFVELNADGPGADGTTAISQKMATYGWDIIGVSEDFNYNTELMSALNSEYNSGTHRGGVSWLTNDTDGLNLIWKKNISVTGEKWTVWNDEYSSGIAGTGNGADSMIEKGYRYYQAEIAEGVAVDVYILHMDAASDAQDIEAREKQLTQLRDAIKASNNGNPIIIMGDTNCRYTRESLQTILIDGINADGRFTIQDTWIEKVRNGSYPEKGADALVAIDKGGTYSYPEAEIVDKIFYINNEDSDVKLTANSYTIATDFTKADGTALADHWPVVVEFGYTLSEKECVHTYQESSRIDATCEAAGSVTYGCSNCGDSYDETIAAIGHNYVDGVCVTCGAKDPDYVEVCTHDYKQSVITNATCEAAGNITYVCSKCGDSYDETIAATGHNYVDGACVTCEAKDPDYKEEIPELELALGEATDEIVSGEQYVIALKSTSGVFAMATDEKSIVDEKITATVGNKLSANQVWTVTEKDGLYTISAEIDGKTYYVARTKTFTGYGYKVTLQEDEYQWKLTMKNGFRFYDQAKYYSSKYYLRYYNAKQGWIASTKAASLVLYNVNK